MLVSETLLGCLGDPAFEVEFDVTASIATGTSELVDFDGDEQPAAVSNSTASDTASTPPRSLRVIDVVIYFPPRFSNAASHSLASF